MSQRLASATVALLGYGHQGEAQALTLRDSGLEVIVGARPGRVIQLNEFNNEFYL